MDNIFDQKALSVETWTVPSSSSYYQMVFPIQVRSQSGETIPKTSSASAPSTSTAGANTTSATPISSSHGSLSTGAIVGIAFGAFFALAFLIAGVMLFLYKNKKAGKKEVSVIQSSEWHQTGGKAELPGQGVTVSSRYRAEPQELPAVSTRL
jgi:hypothetical protein